VEFPAPPPGEVPVLVNLQQTHTERILLRRAEEVGGIDVRFSTEVTGVRPSGDGVLLETSRGPLRARYAVGCDGARSSMRTLLGIDFPGRSFDDRFLIADIRAKLAIPQERRFYFDPPSNRGRQVLIHPQPDDEWRIDWQVPNHTDVDQERDSGVLEWRIRMLIGPDVPYEVVWLTAYRFHQRLAANFRLGPCFVAGDAAHLMAPFGARGMNSGVEDAVNLAWKLALVIRGDAPDTFLDSYDSERRAAGRVNLDAVAATMRFIAPPTLAHRAMRNLVLRASVRSHSARRFVNSGRFHEPASYQVGRQSVGRLLPADGAIASTDGLFTVLACGDDGGEPVRLAQDLAGDHRCRVAAASAALTGCLRMRPQTAYLVRPDGYLAAAVPAKPDDVRHALDAALGGG
jgi:2-polyprenyl-6-methoxyphenol hydroxylase-like FAD-dependent oxidoreductase